MQGHTAEVNAVVMTTDGNKAASGSADSTIMVWNVDRNSRLRACVMHRVQRSIHSKVCVCMFIFYVCDVCVCVCMCVCHNIIKILAKKKLSYQFYF